MHTKISKTDAKRQWLRAQRLDRREPFGRGAKAAQKAIEHLGYVQIDTINVIERSHHHILYSRIPQYRQADLHFLQTQNKTVFEYWTHALSYIPVKDYRYFIRDMKRREASPGPWLQSVKKEDLRRVLRTIKKDGPLSIRDFTDDVLEEKEHPWASRKPSKKALQLGFYGGRLVISERQGMLKKYELAERYFQWPRKPKIASEKEICEYLLERALRSQGVVSLDSICHLNAKAKAQVRQTIEGLVRGKSLLPVEIEGVEKISHWLKPELLDLQLDEAADLVHILNPFDPLVIQRKRLRALFDYEHLFEAYLPKEKRRLGYFALPVLAGDRVVAALDLKTDRERRKLLVQKWTWLGKSRSTALQALIENELHRFSSFQFSASADSDPS